MFAVRTDKEVAIAEDIREQPLNCNIQASIRKYQSADYISIVITVVVADRSI